MNRISRRTVLRGLGASIALPWLEAMGPTSAKAKGRDDEGQNVTGRREGQGAAQRVVFCYTPNGVIGDKWFPEKEGPEFELTPSLEPLADHLDDMIVFSGLDRTYRAGADPHAQCGSCWLTSSPPSEQLDGLLPVNKTLDQLIAESIGTDTTYPSLELSCNSYKDNREPKCFDAISWYGPGHEAPSEKNPRMVFRRLFGNAQSFNRSVLDTVLADARALNGRLGRGDQQKLDEYFESIRAIELRMERARKLQAMRPDIDFPPPPGIPSDRGEYIRLMCDLMVLAFQTDQTRVATLMIAPERWRTPQMYHGVFDKPVSHHEMTHDHAQDDQVAMIDRFHSIQFAHLLSRLKEEKEGEDSLLDNSLVIYGSGLGDGSAHSYKQLPMIVAGSNGRLIEAGRHVTCSPGTPLANLWVSIAQKMGLSLDRYADSTGPLKAIG